MRMHGHGAHDDMSYVPPEMFEEWERRDPIDRYAERLVADHGFSTEEVEGIRSEVRSQVDECTTEGARFADAGSRFATQGVFADAWRAAGRQPGAVVALGRRGARTASRPVLTEGAAS